MYRANVFRENNYYYEEQDELAFVLGFHHSLIELTNSCLEVYLKNGNKLKYSLEFNENDGNTTTHIGKFTNGTPFRLIQPIGMALDIAILKHQAKGYFSIGSVKPDGYGVFFILTDENDYRKGDWEIGSSDTHIQQLIKVIEFYATNDNPEKSIEMSKRLLTLHKRIPIDFTKYNNGSMLVYVLKQSKGHYTPAEQELIDNL